MNFKSNSNNKVVDSFQVFLVDGADFTQIEEYPILKKEMVPSKLPEKIMPFSRAICYSGDLSQTVIYFFSPDSTFERVRRDPKKYLSFFKRTAGIIGPDFSVHDDMPIVKQKSQLNDNLSLSFYYANNGIPLYPSARCGSEELEDEYLAAFPKRTIVALGVHGFIKMKHQKYEWRHWLEKIIDTLEPCGLLIVGHLDKKLIDDFSNRTNFYFYDSFIEERWKEVTKNVN